MNPSTEQKIVIVTSPGAIVDDASLSTGAIDTKGFDYADVYVIIGATDIAMAALKLQQSDAAGTDYDDIENGNFATGELPGGTAATLPSDGADNKVFGWHVDLRGKKRYLDVVATGGDGTAGAYFTVFAVLSKAKESPNSTAERGLSQELFV